MVLRFQWRRTRHTEVILMRNVDIINFLDHTADAQADTFRTYQADGIWKAAQADPSSAISRIDMDLMVFHYMFSVCGHRDLEDPFVRELALRYIDRQSHLMELAGEERASGKWGRTEA